MKTFSMSRWAMTLPAVARRSPAITTPSANVSATIVGPCGTFSPRSEEHTSELQSLQYLVCRLLLEKKKYLYLRLAFSSFHQTFLSPSHLFLLSFSSFSCLSLFSIISSLSSFTRHFFLFLSPLSFLY